MHTLELAIEAFLENVSQVPRASVGGVFIPPEWIHGQQLDLAAKEAIIAQMTMTVTRIPELTSFARGGWSVFYIASKRALSEVLNWAIDEAARNEETNALVRYAFTSLGGGQELLRRIDTLVLGAHEEACRSPESKVFLLPDDGRWVHAVRT